jgi:SET domain-containing protein
MSRKVAKKWQTQDFKTTVKKSKTGKGLFATEDIPKGKCIIEYIGTVVPEKELENKNSKYYFEVGRGITINGNVPWNKAKYINHSCKPNCEADGPRGHVFITSLKKIKAGEELTYDYGEEYFDEHLKPIGCKCISCLAKFTK